MMTDLSHASLMTYAGNNFIYTLHHNVVNMPDTSPEKELQQAFSTFLAYTPPKRLSRGLRSLLLLLLEYEDGMLPDHMRDLPVDMHNLFDLLDVAEKYKNP